MSADRNEQTPATEGYALARRGLPLPQSAATVSRATWLPAAMRSRALPVQASVTSFSTAAEEETEEWIDADSEIPQSLSPPRNEDTLAAVASADATLPQHPSLAPELRAEQARTPDDARASNAMVAPVQNPGLDAPTTPASVSRSSIDAELPNAPVTPQHAARSGEIIADSMVLGSMGQGNAFVLREDGALQVDTSPTVFDAMLEPDHFNTPSPVETVRPHESKSRVSNEIRPELVGPEPTKANAQSDQSLASTTRAAATSISAPQLPAPASMAFANKQDDVHVQMMGLAAASLDSAQPRAPANERPAPASHIGDGELAALLAPTPAAARTVRIDRVQVAVQAPAPAALPPPSTPARTSEPPLRTPPAPSFRNPWSSYFTRRD